ncbi:hypothetical protein [Actinomadura formosensis]|uniref:hypothetical protein n=1 Tax=Actinomadura formosensis TaxID=60706 RepID=UPI003D8BEBA5
MARRLDPCGTTGAYQRHIKAREKPCQACREARNAYERDYRKIARRRHSETSKARHRARGRALTRLARAYAPAFRALFAEELAKQDTTRQEED